MESPSIGEAPPYRGNGRPFCAIGDDWHAGRADLYECASAELDNIDWVGATMTEAARIAGATIVDVVFHKFSPWGISGVVVISESHLAIHIWPEQSYAAVDVFTCGNSVDLDRAVRHLVEAFKAGRSNSHRIVRGKDI